MSFVGKTALVTGAARGIGYAIAARLATHGARVAVADVDGPAAEAAAARIGGDAVAVAADVTKTADVERLVRAVVDRWHRLDIVVNNAGTGARNRAPGPGGGQYVARPPERSWTAPVVNEHSSDASQATSAATSSGVPTRPMGILATM